MKKKVLRMMLCAVLVVAMLALAACGSNDGASKSDNKAEAGADDAQKPEAGADDTQGADDAQEPEAGDDAQGSDCSSGKFASIEDYVNSAEFQAELEAQMGQLDGTGMTMTITGEGNKLVYTYTYEEIVKEDGMAEQLESGIEAQKSTFVEVANSLKLVVDEENPVVAIKYIDANGDEIYATEIPAE